MFALPSIVVHLHCLFLVGLNVSLKCVYYQVRAMLTGRVSLDGPIIIDRPDEKRCATSPVSFFA